MCENNDVNYFVSLYIVYGNIFKIKILPNISITKTF